MDDKTTWQRVADELIPEFTRKICIAQQGPDYTCEVHWGPLGFCYGLTDREGVCHSGQFVIDDTRSRFTQQPKAALTYWGDEMLIAKLKATHEPVWASFDNESDTQTARDIAMARGIPIIESAEGRLLLGTPDEAIWTEVTVHSYPSIVAAAPIQSDIEYGVPSLLSDEYIGQRVITVERVGGCHV